MKGILEGHEKFLGDTDPDSLESLREGQSPEVLMITCSDSRVNPGRTFNAEFGEIFVIRNAGNLVPAQDSVTGGESATIEYAVKALQVKHIVICGHTHCGAMAGLLAPDSLKDLPLVAEWLDHASDTKEAFDALELDEDDDHLDACVRQNVLTQIENLKTYESVSDALDADELTIHGWVYDVGSGRIMSYNHDTEEFESLIEEN